jgi:23S rRNA (uracil747-C5)-methyltransferase
VAEKLYRTASEWADESKPKILWDLFCGVGGFALHCAAPEREIIGIEIEPEAISCARDSAAQMEMANLRFESLDAATFSATAGAKPDLIILNPPRRGLGEQICKWVSRIGADRLLYSSCNAQSLAKDLEMLQGYKLNRVQLFDMFPHTAHYEVLVELVRA